MENMKLETSKDYQDYFGKVFAKVMAEDMQNNADDVNYTKDDARENTTKYFLNESTDYDAVAGMYIGYASGRVDKALRDFKDEMCNVEYRLTEEGEKIADIFIDELKAKRKEILDAGLDTADITYIPVLDDIVDDVNCIGVDKDGNYYNSWGITDNYDSDYPLSLKVGKDLEALITTTERNRKVITILEQIKANQSVSL